MIAWLTILTFGEYDIVSSFLLALSPAEVRGIISHLERENGYETLNREQICGNKIKLNEPFIPEIRISTKR